MPLFRYSCPNGHEIEAIRHRSVGTILCECGASAPRQEVNHVAILGRASVPRDQRSYRKSYGEYREAVVEVADHYERVNKDREVEERVRKPDYYGIAKAQAEKKGAQITA